MIPAQSHRHLASGGGVPRNSAPWWLRFRTFEINLQPRWRSWFFFLGVALCAALMGGVALRAGYVAILSEAVEVGKVQRAVELDPANPDLQHRLGMLLCDSLAETDRDEGLKHLRRATELDPLEARYWSDLAWVCELSGDTTGALQGVAQAVKLSPVTPHVHWVAANTLLRLGQTDAALAEFRALLKLDPTYGRATFHVCLGSFRDPQLILEKVLPADKDPRLDLAYLNFLLTNGLNDQGRQVWASAVAKGTSFPPSLAMPYLDNLIGTGRVEDAQSAWRDLQRLGIVSTPAAQEEGNLVFNGDFEQKPLDDGFDWRSRPVPYMALDVADPNAHTGKFCVRMEFTVSHNDEFMPLVQFVPVAPQQAYLLAAYVRSQDITSDSGPRLQVLDAIHPGNLNAMSETTVGTTPWRQISLQFCTGPQTHLVQLAVMRPRGRTFPTEISGTFWIDTVAMKSTGPASDGVCNASGH